MTNAFNVCDHMKWISNLISLFVWQEFNYHLIGSILLLISAVLLFVKIQDAKGYRFYNFYLAASVSSFDFAFGPVGWSEIGHIFSILKSHPIRFRFWHFWIPFCTSWARCWHAETTNDIENQTPNNNNNILIRWMSQHLLYIYIQNEKVCSVANSMRNDRFREFIRISVANCVFIDIQFLIESFIIHILYTVRISEIK